MRKLIQLIILGLLGFIMLSCNSAHISDASEPLARIDLSEIPSDSVLLYALKPDVPGLRKVYKLRDRGMTSAALEALADYFKEQASHRYYFDWKQFPRKYEDYLQRFPQRMNTHRRLSADLKAMYGPDTQWKLPFKNQRGEEVTAYRLRHLARQSKHPDMVISYFADPPELENLDYWQGQMADLNQAFMDGEFDDEGNGIYEVFRAGKRTHHWLMGHHSYLSTDAYSWQSQIQTLRTFLHTAAQIAERGKKVRHGNHHTRGMVALFEIAASFPEYAQSDEWLKLAIEGVTWHLENEINPDGFQFERTIHYHQSDIENFMRVWQLAQRGGIDLPEVFQTQFKKMFDAMIILAQPDGHLPVLQDDTDAHHAEVNELGDVMAIGSLLWDDPGYQYFSSGEVSPLFFWMLNQQDLSRLGTAGGEVPTLGSTSLPSTGYYVMRNGWEKDDEYMVISAGLSAKKPDHQHADMLGLVAYAYGNEILPNYQVKYNKTDFKFFKGSWVKNVALVDSIPQTSNWKGNRGGSGFGKWLDLPQPEALAFWTGDQVDYFSGTHDGFEGQDLDYEREVLFIRDGFWVVRDQFSNPAGQEHEYQQVWQGLFQNEAEISVIRTFENGSSLRIEALDGDIPPEWRHGRFAAKGNVIRVQRSAEESFAMTTLILPAPTAAASLPENWKFSMLPESDYASHQLELTGADWAIHNGTQMVSFARGVKLGDVAVTLERDCFFHLMTSDEGYVLTLLASDPVSYVKLGPNDMEVSGTVKQAGDFIILK